MNGGIPAGNSPWKCLHCLDVPVATLVGVRVGRTTRRRHHWQWRGIFVVMKQRAVQLFRRQRSPQRLSRTCVQSQGNSPVNVETIVSVHHGSPRINEHASVASLILRRRQRIDKIIVTFKKSTAIFPLTGVLLPPLGLLRLMLLLVLVERNRETSHKSTMSHCSYFTCLTYHGIAVRQLRGVDPN
jgi:hypothetical protein